MGERKSIQDEKDSEPLFDDGTMDVETSGRVATVDEVVRESRRHAIFAIRALRALASGKGGRGAAAQVTAANSILMTARVNGASAEELKVMEELQEKQDRGLRLVSVEDARAEMMRRRAAAAQGS